MHTRCWSRSPRKAGADGAAAAARAPCAHPGLPTASRTHHSPPSSSSLCFPSPGSCTSGCPPSCTALYMSHTCRRPPGPTCRRSAVTFPASKPLHCELHYHCHLSKCPENLLGCVQRWVLWIRFQPFVCSMPWPGSRMQGHPALAESQPPKEGPRYLPPSFPVTSPVIKFWQTLLITMADSFCWDSHERSATGQLVHRGCLPQRVPRDGQPQPQHLPLPGSQRGHSSRTGSPSSPVGMGLEDTYRTGLFLGDQADVP